MLLVAPFWRDRQMFLRSCNATGRVWCYFTQWKSRFMLLLMPRENSAVASSNNIPKNYRNEYQCFFIQLNLLKHFLKKCFQLKSFYLKFNIALCWYVRYQQLFIIFNKSFFDSSMSNRPSLLVQPQTHQERLTLEQAMELGTRFTSVLQDLLVILNMKIIVFADSS